MTSLRSRICWSLGLLFAVLALSAVFAGTAAAMPQQVEGPTGQPVQDPNSVEALGGSSLSHPFPIDNYGLDEQVEWSITEWSHTFDLIMQWIIQMIWEVVIYLLNGILVMLTWAFSLDLLQKSMPQLAADLQTLRDNIITPWGLSAIAAMSLWGIWNGLVRNKTIDTFRGLAASLLCMTALLGLIGNPAGTLGAAMSAANGASTEMLNSISRGTVKDPEEGVATTEQNLFNTVVLRPWDALEFGDVKYGFSKPAGLNQSVNDTWLQDVPDSPWRKSLFDITDSPSRQGAEAFGFGREPPGKDRNLGDMYSLAGQPKKVALIGSGFVMPRLALLALILVGMFGAIALFFYLSVRLLMAAVFILILVMFAPAMFLIAAFGESGRASVIAWVTRLAGAVTTKVIYALFLAVIVEGSIFVTELELGFFPTWIVFIAFWWGVLLKRHDLLALLSLNPKGAAPAGLDFNGASSGNGLSQLFYAKQLAGDGRRVARRLTRVGTALPRVGRKIIRRKREVGRLEKSDAARQIALETLEGEGRTILERRRDREHQEKLESRHPKLRKDRELKEDLTAIDKRIAESKKGPGEVDEVRMKALEDEREKVERDRAALHADPDYAKAWAAAATSKPREVTQAEVRGWVRDRRSELAKGPAAPENLEAAGFDPEAQMLASSLGPAAVKSQQRESQRVSNRHRELLDRAGVDNPGDSREPLSRRELRRVRKEARKSGNLDHYREIAKQRKPRHRQALRNERRRRRVR